MAKRLVEDDCSPIQYMGNDRADCRQAPPRSPDCGDGATGASRAQAGASWVLASVVAAPPDAGRPM